MKVRVRLFAALREAVGRSEVDLELPEGASVEDAWTRLVLLSPGLAEKRQSLSASVNQRYAAFATSLAERDEVVFIPPVSGG